MSWEAVVVVGAPLVCDVTSPNTEAVGVAWEKRKLGVVLQPSVCPPQAEVLGLKLIDGDGDTLGLLSCDQEIVTGPGETRAVVLGKADWEASSRSGWGDGEAFGAGAPGTRTGICPSEGKDVVEKGEGAGLSGGGLGG